MQFKTYSTTQNNSLYCCFNPQCLYIFQRLFRSNDQHFYLKNCKKWLLEVNQIHDNSYEIYITENLLMKQNKISLQFFKEPLKMIKLSSFLHKIVQQNVIAKFQLLKQQIGGLINVIQHNTMNKVKKIFQSPKQMFNKIQNILRQVNQDPYYISNAITMFMDSYKLRIEELKDITIFNNKVINQQITSIKKSLEKIMDGIICQTQKNTTLNLKQSRILRQFLVANGDFVKQGQSIIKITKAKLKQFFITKNQQSKVNCLFCDWVKTFNLTNSKDSKKISMQNLIEHILDLHQQQAMFYYITRVSKKTTKELKTDQVLYYMKNHDYQMLELIDRTNVHRYTEYFNCENKTLAVEITIPQQTQNISTKHIIAINKDVHYAIFIVLIYLVSKNYKKKVNVISCSKIINRVCDFFQKQGMPISYRNPQNICNSKLKKQEQDDLNRIDQSKQPQVLQSFEQTAVLNQQIDQPEEFSFNQ